MLKRRDLLRGIGALVGVGVVGKVTDAKAAPVEVSPVVQAPQVSSISIGTPAWPAHHVNPSGTAWWYSAVSDSANLSWPPDCELPGVQQYAFGQSQLYNGRHVAPVLGGVDDDGGAG